MPCFNEGPSNTNGLIKVNHFTVFEVNSMQLELCKLRVQ